MMKEKDTEEGTKRGSGVVGGPGGAGGDIIRRER